ncbi:hypothetical protein BGZ68_005955 [Mortierella alpina]|nr:hypothetical protein BGZ68_005955 [Mortierella alpina]
MYITVTLQLLPKTSAVRCLSFVLVIHSISHSPQQNYGAIDAYVRGSFQLKRNDDVQKTVVKTGPNPSWEQILLLRNLRPEYENLYVEVMDMNDIGGDDVIAYCAIPLSQVYSQPAQRLSAMFDLWTLKSARKGDICLTIRVLPLGEEVGSTVAFNGSDKKGISTLRPEHEKWVKSLKLGETDGIDVAAFSVGTGAATHLASDIFISHPGGDRMEEDE